MLGDSEYQNCARAKIDKGTTRLKTKLNKIACKLPGKEVVCLVFSIQWNAIHELILSASPEGSNFQAVSTSAPYGDIFHFDAPETERNRPKGYASDKPIVAKYLIERISQWWSESLEQPFPIPVYGTYEGELSIYDFVSMQWKEDPRRVVRETLETEFRLLVKQRLELFEPALYKRLTDALKKVGEGPYSFEVEIFHDDDFQVMYMLRSDKKSTRGSLYPPHSELTKILSRDPYVERVSEFIEKGADVDAIYKAEHVQLLSKLWNRAVSPAQSATANLVYHDDGAVFDLKLGRWVTDFLGRSLDD